LLSRPVRCIQVFHSSLQVRQSPELLQQRILQHNLCNRPLPVQPSSQALLPQGFPCNKANSLLLHCTSSSLQQPA
jgi:hypothetical protein